MTLHIPIRTPADRDPSEALLSGDSSDYAARARRIVDRVLPELPACNPLYDREGFIRASRRHGERSELYWLTFARLRAKAEGGRPYITLPAETHAIEGSGMWRAAVRLSDDRLAAIVKGHRSFERQERRAAHRRGEGA